MWLYLYFSEISRCRSEVVKVKRFCCFGVGLNALPTHTNIWGQAPFISLSASNGDGITLGNWVSIRELVENDDMVIESSSGFSYKQVSTIPEPTTLAIMSVGMLFLFFRVKRQFDTGVHRCDARSALSNR